MRNVGGMTRCWGIFRRKLPGGAAMAFLALCCLVLTGCLGLPAKSPLALVAPQAGDIVVATRTEALPQQLLVALPQASTLLDSRRVLSRDAGGDLALLAGVAWPEPLPTLLQGALVEALQRVPFRAVERAGSGVRGDLVLNLTLHRMELDFAAGEAVVEFEALLLAQGGRALGSRRFRAVESIAQRAARPAAGQLLTLSQRLLGECVGWVAATAGQPAGTSG
jgi:ABC-type uncharacterized transport system auxiliary subunit